MAPHPPDDPESGHPHPPADSGDRPEPPLHVYALDCLDQGQPPDAVRRQLVALGCSPDEARRIVDAVIARHAPASAWSPEDAPARRGMTVGFTLFVAGI